MIRPNPIKLKSSLCGTGNYRKLVVFNIYTQYLAQASVFCGCRQVHGTMQISWPTHDGSAAPENTLLCAQKRFGDYLPGPFCVNRLFRLLLILRYNKRAKAMRK